MTPFKMLLLLLIAVIVLREATSARPDCTAKDMEGLRVVGYAFKRVFRFTDYSKVIDLETVLRKILKFRTDLIRNDVGLLIHLHQGFDHSLMVLRYGRHLFNSSFGGLNLRDELIYNSRIYLTVLDEASVDVRNKINVRVACYECGNQSNAESKDFSSFVYDDRIHYEGGFSNARQFRFVQNASDLCPEMQFPVVDIAVDPPLCVNRVLKEFTTGNSAQDEWIVSLVKGIRTTRSADPVLCYQGGDGDNYVETSNGEVVFPNHDNYCYFLKKPGMETPCKFAYGSKYMFSDVQLEPADPVRMAMKTSSTAATPTTTGQAFDPKPDEPKAKEEPNSSEMSCNSWLLCSFLLISQRLYIALPHLIFL